MSKTMIIIALAISTAVVLYLCFLSIKLLRIAKQQAASEKAQARMQQRNSKQIDHDQQQPRRKK